MRRLLAITGLLILTLCPTAAFAAQFRTDENNVIIGQNEAINNDLYTASGNVAVDGNVTGDLMVAGGTVNVNGSVGADLNAAGGNITVNGSVGDDLRVGGGNIVINGPVTDDLFIAGGTVAISRSANIGGEVYVSGGQVTVSGTTGPIKAAGGSLTIASGARVNGDVLFYSRNNPKVEQGATVTGSVTRRAPPADTDVRGVAAFFTTIAILMAIASILLGILVVYIFPNAAAAIAENWRERFWWSLLWGFLFLVLLPLISFILFLTVIGIPLAVGLLLLYPVFMYLGMLAGFFALGVWILRLARRQAVPLSYFWLAVVIGGVIYYVLSLIPVLGWLLALIIRLAGLGALLIFLWNIGGRLRRDKAI